MRILLRLVSILLSGLFAATPGLLQSEESGIAVSSDVANHMHDHLGRITTIKSFIIFGDLEKVREPATWLAEHESVFGLAENFGPSLKLMREFSRQVVEAPDLQTAAVAVSSIARSCGDCHLQNNVGLAFGYDSVPDDWADTISHMQRHQWGMDRLWEGLIGPSDVAWARGSDMLVDVPLKSSAVVGAATNNVDLAALDKITTRIHALGSRGADAKSQAQRSAMYAELLNLCAECHTKTGRGPGH